MNTNGKHEPEPDQNASLRDHLAHLRGSLDNLRARVDQPNKHRNYQDRMHVCTRLIVACLAIDEAIDRLGQACDREGESLRMRDHQQQVAIQQKLADAAEEERERTMSESDRAEHREAGTRWNS